MSLWGCQLGKDFFNCASAMYPMAQFVLIVAVFILLITALLTAVKRVVFPRE